MRTKAQEAEVMESQEEVIQGKPYTEKYFEVVFAEKSNENDTIDVQLCVNGEALTIQRGRPVVVPQRYLEAADHTKSEVISQEPGKDRKTVAWVQTFTYTKLREATKEEFYRLKKHGDQQTKEARERMQMATV